MPKVEDTSTVLRSPLATFVRRDVPTRWSVDRPTNQPLWGGKKEGGGVGEIVVKLEGIRRRAFYGVASSAATRNDMGVCRKISVEEERTEKEEEDEEIETLPSYEQ